MKGVATIKRHFEFLGLFLKKSTILVRHFSKRDVIFGTYMVSFVWSGVRVIFLSLPSFFLSSSCVRNVMFMWCSCDFRDLGSRLIVAILLSIATPYWPYVGLKKLTDRYLCMYSCKCICVCVCVYVCLCTRVYVCTHVCLCMSPNTDRMCVQRHP